ncbi:MAG: HD domain-containing protein [Phycisphaeraceae bacterium]|nr:HD domain-containing protein [Phycisphaeraceae bacterium]
MYTDQVRLAVATLMRRWQIAPDELRFSGGAVVVFGRHTDTEELTVNVRRLSRRMPVGHSEAEPGLTIRFEPGTRTEVWLRVQAILDTMGVELPGRVGAGMAWLNDGADIERAARRAARAMRLSLARGQGLVCTWEMVAIRRLAWRIGRHRHLGPRQRLMLLLRSSQRLLGPTQIEHLVAHSQQVGDLAARLASELGCPPNVAERARTAGAMHDLGKAVIPEELLAKPGALTPSERAIMDRHADEGARLGRGIGLEDAIVRSIAHHHTRYDARAFLAKGAVSNLARLLNVADAVVTMRSRRPYRPALAEAETIRELQTNRATQFDPIMVDATLRVLRTRLAAAA